LAIDAETRKLVDLFQAALALPDLAEDHEHFVDCPLCGTDGALTPDRIAVIRKQVQSAETYQNAENDLMAAFRNVDGTLNALAHSATQALPKFALEKSAVRRARGFTINRVRELVDDSAIIAEWINASQRLMRGTRRLRSTIKMARDEIVLAIENSDTWSKIGELNRLFSDVEISQQGFVADSGVYGLAAQALSGPLRLAVEKSTTTEGWDSLISLSRESTGLWKALTHTANHAVQLKNLEKSLREIDAGNGKVADEKFDDLSESVKKWWEHLRPGEPVFFNAVQRRSAKARRTIDLKVGLSAKEDRSNPLFRDAVAVFSQSQLHCLGLALFLARAVQEGTGFVVLDDPVLTSDDDFRPNFASTVIENLLAANMQIIVVTQDHGCWKDIGHRWGFRNAAQLQIIRDHPVLGSEIRNQNDGLATMIAKAHPFIQSQDPEQRKQGAIQIRDSIERFAKELLVRELRANGHTLSSITDYDGQNFGNFSAQVYALLTIDPSHPGKLRSAYTYVTPGPHDDTPPSTGQLKSAIGELKRLKKDYLG
jgi:hypothetical protein